MASLRKQYPEKTIEIWAEDESRMGLQPVIRRTWARKGGICKAPNYRKYQWLYTYMFVRPSDGETYWWMFPTVNSEAIDETLKKFVKEYNPSGEKIMILLWDQAGFHRGSGTGLIEGIELFPLPPYTPELQPVERVWPLLREAMANKVFESIEHLEEVLIKRIRWLVENPSIIQKVTGFHWILSVLMDTS